MQLQTTHPELTPRMASAVRCPHCGDTMVAALASEFVDTGEIRHHWGCDVCGEDFTTTVTLD